MVTTSELCILQSRIKIQLEIWDLIKKNHVAGRRSLQVMGQMASQINKIKKLRHNYMIHVYVTTLIATRKQIPVKILDQNG